MAERDIFRPERAGVAELAFIEEPLQARESTVADGPVFSCVEVLIERTVFAIAARGQVPAPSCDGKAGTIQRRAVNAATKLDDSRSVGQMAAIFRLARPHQWIKNALVLAALVFGQRLFVFHDVVLAIVAFVAFCALSSAGYILNDIADRDADRLNPEKCDRPLARGDLTVAAATRAAVMLAAIAIVLSIVLGREFVGIALLYAALQLFYSLWAKHQ